MYFKKIFFSSILLSIFFLSSSYAADYVVDKDHSSVNFSIRHLFSKVRGAFNDFEATISYEPGKPESWVVKATAQAASIDTKVKERDNHLRSADFFEVEKYPTLTFVSNKVTEATETSAKLHGDLTLHGVTKAVVFDLEVLGVGPDPWGNTLAAFEATTKINRKDFGLAWNEVLETGQFLVGEEVEITLEISAMQQ